MSAKNSKIAISARPIRTYPSQIIQGLHFVKGFFNDCPMILRFFYTVQFVLIRHR